ncbi:MAG: ferritin-like domain-containing protein, partial [Proteobacteria bacterium]|nr:ferritin-like domain-containing protein [Pseudomonadota bacterium]
LLVPAGVGTGPRRGRVEVRVVAVSLNEHIEFNAVNLALDAVQRFRGLPDDFYGDWLRVAAEEARHFELLTARLQAMDSAYGELPAHDGLWDAARRTAHDPLLRMALVPRVLEARGLDVTPGMIERLRQAGDAETVAVLEVILAEEVGHVAIGSRWYAHLCAERGLEPRSTFRRLLAEHRTAVFPPYNVEARLAGGFAAEELDALAADAAAGR